ncbi:calcium uptake protein 3, mitochondrial-like isoform X5 [Varroa destructor]|uniref:EF-hand domain-containing protein n=1 Tax=Varroa destructor TaxID=109461 RepID=A0A7M7JTN3_VARDE|nr:calcium uptake protein 3, mitochondrial-like isoform X5 [Varroa destructor]
MSQAIQRMPRIRGMIRPLSVLSVSGAIRPLSGGAPVRVEYIDRPFVRRGESWHRRYAWTAAVFSGGCIGMGYIVAKYFANEVKEVQSSEFYDSSTDHAAAEELQLTPREKRFMRFASVEYDGQLYMTPQDFLDSVTDPDPRSRISRRKLSRKDLDKMTDVTPSKKKGSTKLFRELNDTGIISYTEYLFLLSVLTKPHSGFRIAFNMFDTDGNQRVDKNEFLVLERIFSTVARRGKNMRSVQETDVNELSAAAGHVNTTLLVHLFGRKGKETLSFEDFFRFMENLQSEVLELEFIEYSKGKAIISEVDFARILLRYTYLDSTGYEAVLERLQERIPETRGISFEQFKAFCQFLNNLEDFAITMRLFTFANQPISEEDFRRAVYVCSGHNLKPHLVHTVFQIFDDDGDGFLSYKEFIAIMRDRLHRGLKAQLGPADAWEAFKSCVKDELRCQRSGNISQASFGSLSTMLEDKSNYYNVYIRCVTYPLLINAMIIFRSPTNGA